MNVRALVAGELIDQYTSVAVEVNRAFAATARAARRDGWAVCLPSVLKGAGLGRVSLVTMRAVLVPRTLSSQVQAPPA